jgi:histidinol-phosphatase (PHP family)
VRDAHVHIERGPYTEEWIDAFVNQAQAAGIDELYLLEHSFRFFEFKPLYRSIVAHPEAGKFQAAWLESRCRMHLADYQDLVSRLRARRFPITLKLGLEICYFPEFEDEIRELVSTFDWDFLTGSLHWIDGFGFDQDENIHLWQKMDKDLLYQRYFELETQAISCGFFDIIAHPDSIKCFNIYPSISLEDLYRRVAEAANRHGVALEFSAGLRLNYGHDRLGLEGGFLKALKAADVTILTASDAHRPEDVGKYIRESEEAIQNGG